MLELYQLLKELKIPASESKVFITKSDNKADCSGTYQLELDLENQPDDM